MLSQTIRASRSSIARVARQQAGGYSVAKRTFITPTAVRQADLVQDLYIRELKAYKVPAVKANDAEGNVQKWAAPKAPKSPEEADIANELKSYETSAVEIEGQAEGGAPASTEFEWFEEEPEEEAAHH
ncbi:ATP synthase subunit H [Lachnellula suecica]|uniref:ATP synthase subunit H n=1 Tax=Lachnellula suecica TaxID=602035 RepID=A0A8T9BRC3_9HELO|nr:ATP synthase subunit H [Lachnellula suecica]